MYKRWRPPIPRTGVCWSCGGTQLRLEHADRLVHWFCHACQVGWTDPPEHGRDRTVGSATLPA